MPIDYDADDEDDSGDSDDEDENLVSDEQELGHYLATLGFRPKDSVARDTLEFAKTYSASSGILARVVAVVAKDDMGLTPKKADYFTLTVQRHFRADEKEILSSAPDYCKQDMLRVLSYFGDVEERDHGVIEECALCGVRGAEFVKKEEGLLCFDCAKRRHG